MHLTEKCRALLPTIQAEWAATELAADALEAELPTPLRMVPISGVNFVVGVGGLQLGNFEAGLVGSLASPVVSVVSGGLATIAGVLALRLAVPALAHYDVTATTEEELEQEPDDDEVTA